MNRTSNYRGRLAPSPTGLLHLGHARTFWTAQERARACGGTLILRNEDLDTARCKPGFVEAMFEDLRWFGFDWSEGPDVGGKFGPYNQSERMDFYRAALERLHAGNFIYSCTCSRKDIQAAVTAPHAADDEMIYPGTCRPQGDTSRVTGEMNPAIEASSLITRLSRRSEAKADHSSPPAWRFRVPDGEEISFTDGNFGLQEFVAGKDFGDFVVWRGADVPAYQLACVVDDAAMQISEVVRGADLLVSTARQVLLYRALELTPPAFFHCELLKDEAGQRLAKQHDALSLRQLRAREETPCNLRVEWGTPNKQT